MSMRRRRERVDKLDAALDGRLVEVDDDLAPLVETAAELRAALTGIELDPEAAERHLGMVLESEATVVPLPTRPQLQASLWRRRVAAVALAAALTVVPATMASASALPGQALYPVKLAVEQLQLTAVIWSRTREANERIKITHKRLDELNRLIQLHAADRIPSAITRLDQACVEAQQAVDKAGRDSSDISQTQALDAKVAAVRAALDRLQEQLDQGMLSTSALQAATAATQPPVMSGLVRGAPQPVLTTSGPVGTTGAGSGTTHAPTTTTVVATTTTEVATTTTEAATTTTEAATTTTEAAITTQVPTTTTVATDVSNSPDQGDDDSGQGSSGTATTLP